MQVILTEEEYNGYLKFKEAFKKSEEETSEKMAEVFEKQGEILLRTQGQHGVWIYSRFKKDDPRIQEKIFNNPQTKIVN